MNLAIYVGTLQEQLVAAADSGEPESRAAVERLAHGLEAAVRLVLLEALSGAVDEITRELAPGAVEVPVMPAGDDEEGTSRLNLRVPEGFQGPS